MPGKITSVAVKTGDAVVVGQEICVIEAMKMQNILKSPSDCKVKKVACKVGETVGVDEILVEFE